MRGGRWLVAVAATALVVGACGVDDDDLRGLEELPGVTSARSSCDLTCVVTIRMAEDVDADDLATVIDESRSVSGARRTEVVLDAPGTASVTLGRDSDVDTDAERLAEVLVGVRGEPRLTSASASVGPRAAVITVTTRGSTPIEGLDAARERWRSVGTLERPRLTFQAFAEQGRSGAVRVSADAVFPDDAVDLVRDVVSGPDAALVSGVAIDQDAVVLGSPTPDSARRLESVLPDVEGVDVRVVVSASLPRVETGAVENDAAVRAVLDALQTEGLTGVSAEDTTVTIDASAGSPGDVADAIDAARAAEPEAAKTIRTTVRIGTTGEVELGTSGSTDLVGLAARLERLDDLAELGIGSADTRPQRTPKPPQDTDASLSLRLEPAPSLDVAIAAVAPVVNRWRSADVDSLSLYLTAVDDEGRRPTATLRLDRRNDRWVASGLGRGTAEGERQAVAAWTAASRR